MIVCICKAVSDKRIRRAASEGVVSLRDLSRELGVGTCCGKCVPQAREILAESIPAEPIGMTHLMGMQATA
jgi:bacterioferritin-associated ferredoxin